jgi:arylformamidase
MNLSPSDQLIDVSHVIEHGMITYKGVPAPIICDYLSRELSRVRYAPGTEFHIGKIEMVANTGTYLDTPFHRYEDGKDLADLSLDRLANIPCIVARVDTNEKAIDKFPFSQREVRGKALLIETRWDRHWRSDAYFEDHPHLTAAAAQWLIEADVRIVGIDSYNIDSIATGERPVHSLLLKNEIPIVEHMRGLSAVPDRGGRFFAVPPKIKRFGTFPVRAFVAL